MLKTGTDRMTEIRALKRMKDSSIDTTDIAPISDWSNAVIGKFYRPIKKPVTIRLDADVLARLKAAGGGYQTRINDLLRKAMERNESRIFVVRLSDYGEFAA
ncbi:BrnA antitoxin family protein [Nevskia soli]|uniref:BrnA antitoxin family protein n=1 Tax=Nevskia soli TaxID=418856 RepID=UPI0015D682BC